ncbi:MAG: amidohydrolase family protein [candidate division KSB1 bacterium]|nr:amidohydrolase family protein [candidate division KSB1 bacterium]
MPGRLRFYDGHCRVGSSQRQRPETRLSVGELLQVFQSCGIERALVTHAYALELDPWEGNRRAAGLCRQHPELVPCFVALPHHTGEMPRGEELLAYLAEGGARAVRLCPRAHRFRLGEIWVGELLNALDEGGYPVLVSADEIELEELSGLLRDHSGLRIVLLRPWYRDARLLYPLLERFDNLFLEISFYQTFRGLEDLAERFGSHRLLFGSALPDFDACATVSAVRWADLSWEWLEDIAWRNLARLLRLPA